jgi:hypothetical protein
MSVSSLREFLENCVYRHGGFSYFIKYLHRKLLTTNFYLYIDYDMAFCIRTVAIGSMDDI